MNEDQHRPKDSDWEPWKSAKDRQSAKSPESDENKDSGEPRDEEQQHPSWKFPSAYFSSLFQGETRKTTYKALALAGLIFAALVAINVFVSPRTRPIPTSELKFPAPKLEAAKPPASLPAQTGQPTPDKSVPKTPESVPAQAEQKAQKEAPVAGSTKEQPAGRPAAGAAKEVEGVGFTLALMKTLDYELNKATFGWRPNSLLFGKLGLTDNVNNRQLGVLETVRTVSVVLKDKISRYGDADAFNPRLENAVNFFMNSAFQFWFPSADSQFNDGLDEIKKYVSDLQAGKARFYPRSDNFTLLVHACKELLGNCYQNLVKRAEADGSPVSMRKVDDYFYYAQGVARAMGVILDACLTDFVGELDQIKGTRLLLEVVGHLKVAGELNPLIVLDGELDGLRANHRANLAVPLGEAHFKLSNLLKY